MVRLHRAKQYYTLYITENNKKQNSTIAFEQFKIDMGVAV